MSPRRRLAQAGNPTRVGQVRLHQLNVDMGERCGVAAGQGQQFRRGVDAGIEHGRGEAVEHDGEARVAAADVDHVTGGGRA